jgi:ubiquinone/menaquinone biosynthesis C-methylase UbiE
MNSDKTTRFTAKLKKRRGIYYMTDERGNFIKYKPWLGDMFSFLYDRIMEKSIFPKKFNGSIDQHFKILREEFTETHRKNILEIAAGSGNAVEFLPYDNNYCGTDISAGLLRIAARKFKKHKFIKSDFYISDASLVPIENNKFDICICNLSVNFFNDLKEFILETRRLLKHDGYLFCSIPLPEKKAPEVKIRGKLYSKQELKEIFTELDFRFESLDKENGALIYFRAHKQ